MRLMDLIKTILKHEVFFIKRNFVGNVSNTGQDCYLYASHLRVECNHQHKPPSSDGCENTLNTANLLIAFVRCMLYIHS